MFATLRTERGIALASAMFGLVAVSLLINGIFVMTDLQARAGQNREAALRAQHIAEAGLTHALATLRRELKDTTLSRLLRGFDNNAATPDDNGYLIGYPIPADVQIPANGVAAMGGTYYVQLLDDPADNDGNPMQDANGQVLLRCRGVTAGGAVADVEGIVSLTLLPGVVTDGALQISGNPEILGACGGVHANAIVVLNGDPIVSTQVSATGIVEGDAELPNGQPAPTLSNQPPLDVPVLNPLDHCGPADFILQSDGFILEVATGMLHNANANEKFGWKKSGSNPVVWDLAGNSATAGTVCAHGNVKISGNPGSDAQPLALSVIATGSIELSGNPNIRSAHPDNIALLAGGDLKINGNPEMLTNDYSGLLYALSQCDVGGNPHVNGQLVCKNLPNAANTSNHIDVNSISGNPEIRFECGNNLLNKRTLRYWYPRLGA
jgi:hypothetical protein